MRTSKVPISSILFPLLDNYVFHWSCLGGLTKELDFYFIPTN